MKHFLILLLLFIGFLGIFNNSYASLSESNKDKYEQLIEAKIFAKIESKTSESKIKLINSYISKFNILLSKNNLNEKSKELISYINLLFENKVQELENKKSIGFEKENLKKLNNFNDNINSKEFRQKTISIIEAISKASINHLYGREDLKNSYELIGNKGDDDWYSYKGKIKNNFKINYFGLTNYEKFEIYLDDILHVQDIYSYRIKDSKVYTDTKTISDLDIMKGSKERSIYDKDGKLVSIIFSVKNIGKYTEKNKFIKIENNEYTKYLLYDTKTGDISDFYQGVLNNTILNTNYTLLAKIGDLSLVKNNDFLEVSNSYNFYDFNSRELLFSNKASYKQNKMKITTKLEQNKSYVFASIKNRLMDTIIEEKNKFTY